LLGGGSPRKVVPDTETGAAIARLGRSDIFNSDTASVGDESSTQFNRDYKRLFGDAPRRDIAGLQALRSAVE